MCAGAFADPSVWLGSAPGTPINGAGRAVEAGLFGDAGDAGLFTVVVPGVGRVAYHAEPIATASTMRMMMKGSDRFMFRVLNGSGGQCCRKRTKDVAAVAGAEEIFARAFRMRH